MDARQPGPGRGHDRELLLGGGDAHTAARYFALEREKQELRRERDVVMLRIARDIGEGALAQRLDVTPAVLGKLLAGARKRLDASSITVRRMSASRERWADVDSHYEALGAGPRISPRRRLPPQP